MKLSVLIPARDEAEGLQATVRALAARLAEEHIDHEILVVNDGSADHTRNVLAALEAELPALRHIDSGPPHGFGLAVRAGLAAFTGDCVALYMADASDTPEDLIRFFRALEERGVDCVFGSRWGKNARVVDYPAPKWLLNRAANRFIQALFGLGYDDTTNAFKLYRRKVIEGLQPLLSHHFNLTVELPLKAIVRGFTYTVVPNDWVNRKSGVSRFKIEEMGSRYLFIVLYCFLEKWLSRGDYRAS